MLQDRFTVGLHEAPKSFRPYFLSDIDGRIRWSICDQTRLRFDAEPAAFKSLDITSSDICVNGKTRSRYGTFAGRHGTKAPTIIRFKLSAIFTDRQAVQQSPPSHWFSPLRSAGVLLLGKTAQGALSIAYLALAARTLGIADFGALVVLNGLLVSVSEIARFDSWQVVLHYGTKPLETGDRARLHQVLKFTLLLDIAGSVMGLAVVFLGLSAAFELFGLPREYEGAARIFSVGVVFLISTGGASGVLRLLDRFDLISWQTTIAPIVRLIGTLVLFVVGGGLEIFLWLWLAGTVIARSALHYLAWRELYRCNLLAGFNTGSITPLAKDGGIWRFVLGTSANATLAVVDKHAGLLAVGWLLGPASAGFYRVALHLADLLIKPNRAFLAPAMYPELARHAARDTAAARAKMMWRSMLIVGGVSIGVFAALVIFGQHVVLIIFGPGFDAAYGVMIFLALAGVIANCMFPLEPLLVSTGRVRTTVLVRVISVAVYFVLLYLLLQSAGLIGGGIASCVYAGVRALLLGWLTRRQFSSPQTG